ncbi:MAG: hypothetical protein K6A94_00990 [Bacteroidales bacterium]|nr:hypothetical protein [Bacteroidales bacterium]
MAKASMTGDRRIATMEDILMKMCRTKGYDLDTAFKGLLDYLLWMFDLEGNKPESWRFDQEDAKMFYEMSCAYFKMMEAEMKSGTEWYDAFGDLYMALHPGGGGKAQFFTPQCLCSTTAELCMRGMDISEAKGATTPFGHRICINDPAAGSSRLLLAGAAVFRNMQRDQLGYDEIQQTSRRPYLIAEDMDYNCVKMSAINMAVHGHFGECVCHDSLGHPEEVLLGYMVNEAMYPFPTNLPSIRRVNDPMRFVCTTSMMMRRKLYERQEAEKQQPKPEPIKEPETTKENQLSLW